MSQSLFFNRTRTSIILILLGVAAAVIVVFWSTRVEATDNRVSSTQPQPAAFLYSVKVVCVPELGPPDPALVPVRMYRTAVNVHNPWPTPATVVKWVTLSPPQGEPSVMSEPISHPLEPFNAFDVDCRHMVENFGLADQQVPGGKGFMIIQSDVELDVVGVYTAGGAHGALRGNDVSIDVEYISPRTMQVPGNPDLTVALINAPTEVSCPDGPGTCTATVEFEITNLSMVDVTDSFEVLIEAEEVPSQTITVSGLAAGATMTFSETLGPGNNCYNPDCTVTVTVDVNNDVIESDEGNNVATRTDLG